MRPMAPSVTQTKTVERALGPGMSVKTAIPSVIAPAANHPAMRSRKYRLRLPERSVRRGRGSFGCIGSRLSGSDTGPLLETQCEGCRGLAGRLRRLLERLRHLPQRRAVDALAAEQLVDREQLQPRVLAPGRGVEAGCRRLFAHRPGRLLHADQDADHGLLAVDDAAELVHVGTARVAGLHADDDLLHVGAVAFVKVDAPVDALVGALLALDAPGVDLVERPPLE